MLHLLRYSLKFLAVFFCATFVLAKDVNLIFVSSGSDSDPFWNVVKNGVINAAKDSGAKVEYRNSATGDRTEMARLIQSAISKRPDGLIVSIPDKDALSKDIKRAIELGIPVLNVNSGQEYGKELGVIMYIGMSEYEAGMLAGKRAKAAGVKSFVCVNHEITNTVLEQRCQGFADGIGTKNNMIDAGMDPTESQRRLAPHLGKVDAVLTLGPAGAIPAISLIRSRRVDTYFATFDLSKEITEGIKDGTVKFAIDQQPYLQGYLPVIFLTQYAKYGTLPSTDVKTGPSFVDKSNVDLVEKLAGQYR